MYLTYEKHHTDLRGKYTHTHTHTEKQQPPQPDDNTYHTQYSVQFNWKCPLFNNGSEFDSQQRTWMDMVMDMVMV